VRTKLRRGSFYPKPYSENATGSSLSEGEGVRPPETDALDVLVSSCVPAKERKRPGQGSQRNLLEKSYENYVLAWTGVTARYVISFAPLPPGPQALARCRTVEKKKKLGRGKRKGAG